jgi:hypothetical protein
MMTPLSVAHAKRGWMLMLDWLKGITGVPPVVE